VHVEQDRFDEADDGGVVRDDPDDAGAALDLLVDPLDGVGRSDRAPARGNAGVS
jgi:hypothetical protein